MVVCIARTAPFGAKRFSALPGFLAVPTKMGSEQPHVFAAEEQFQKAGGVDLYPNSLMRWLADHDNPELLLLRATGRVFHFLLRTHGWPSMIAVVSSRATRQKGECYEEHWSYDFRYCPA